MSLTTPETEVFGQDELKELSRELLKDNKTIKLRLGGFSMYPNLIPGDIATIKSVKPQALKCGQVVVVESEGRWIAHRLVGWRKSEKGTRFILQGDNIPKPDALVGADQIIGVVEQLERQGENVSQFALSSLMYVFLRPLPQLVGRSVFKLKMKLGPPD